MQQYWIMWKQNLIILFRPDPKNIASYSSWKEKTLKMRKTCLKLSINVTTQSILICICLNSSFLSYTLFFFFFNTVNWNPALSRELWVLILDSCGQWWVSDSVSLCFHVDDKFSACFVCFFVSSFRIWFLQYLFYLASVWEESDVTSSLSVDLQLLSVVY